MKLRRAVFVPLLVVLLILGVSTANAGVTAPQTRAGSMVAGKAWTTLVQRNHGWIQLYGKMRVVNLTGHHVHTTCTVTAYQGHGLLGVAETTLLIPAWQGRSASWAIEGGAERGRLLTTFGCRSRM